MSASQMLNDFAETLRNETFAAPIPERLYGPLILSKMIVPANEVIIQNHGDWIPDLRGFSIMTNSIRHEPTSEDKALDLRGMMDEWAEEQEDAAIDLHGEGHYYQVTDALRLKELIYDRNRSNTLSARDVVMDRNDEPILTGFSKFGVPGVSIRLRYESITFFDMALSFGNPFLEAEPELDIPEYTI